MRKLKDEKNSFVSSSSIRLFLTGLLLVSLLACENEKPETISSELDLHLPNIGNGQFSSPNPPSHDNLNADIVETETTKEEEPLTESDQQFSLNSIHLKAKNSKIFAQNGSSALFMEDEFYLLGWSADGEKIAYAIKHETDAAALFSVGVYIQDLVSDKIIWGMKKEMELEKLNNIKDYWKENQQQIMKGIDQHKIILGNNFTLKDLPISYNNDQFSYTVKTTKASVSTELKGYRILLRSKNKGSKEIAKVALKIRGNLIGGKEKVAVIGYFQGSDKARVATLVGLLESGWEGSRIVRYKIIGASLKYGKWYK